MRFGRYQQILDQLMMIDCQFRTVTDTDRSEIRPEAVGSKKPATSVVCALIMRYFKRGTPLAGAVSKCVSRHSPSYPSSPISAIFCGFSNQIGALSLLVNSRPTRFGANLGAKRLTRRLGPLAVPRFQMQPLSAVAPSPLR